MRKLNFNSNIDFEEYLNSKNIEIDEVRKKLSYELLWNKLIYEKFNKNIKIDKKKIEKILKENTTQYEYLLSEILFNVENKEKLNQKYKNIESNILELGFNKAAVINSIKICDNEGLIDVKETSISPKIKIQVRKINKGEYTKPIQVPGGFLILFINDIRKVKKAIDLDED